MTIYFRSPKQASKFLGKLFLLSIGSIAAMSAAQAATSLKLTNPKFTTNPIGVPGWMVPNTQMVTWSATGGYENSGAIKLVDPGANVAASFESEPVSVMAGRQIDLSARIKLENTANPGSVMLGIKFYAGTTLLPDTKSMGAVGNNGQWLPTALSVIAPAGATKASVLLFTANAGAATAYFDNISFTTPDIQDKGDQITRSLVSAAAFDGDVLYVGATGHPAKFIAYNVNDGQSRYEIEFPQPEEVLSVAVAADHTVHVGTASGRLYQHIPGNKTIELVGKSDSGAIAILRPSSNGIIYGGGSTSTTAFTYNTRDGRLTPLTGPVDVATNVHALAVDTTNEKLYWGIGIPAAVYQTDLAGNNPKNLLDDIKRVGNWDYAYYRASCKTSGTDENCLAAQAKRWGWAPISGMI